MRKLISLLVLSLVMILGVTAVSQAATAITVLVNNKAVAFPDEKPYIDKNNRTLVPVRFVSEALGAEVSWDNNTRTVTIVQSTKTSIHENTTKTVKLKIGESKATVNGQVKTFDTVAAIKNGRTMVPLRFVSEVLGAKVEWIGSTKTVKITVNNGYTLPKDTELLIQINPPNDNPNNVDIDILVGLDKDLEKQYNDLYEILNSKFGSTLAKEIVDYVKTKKTRREALTPKRWNPNKQTIEVGANKGDIDISITIWK